MKTICVVHHSLTPKDLPANQAETSFNNNHKSRGFPRSRNGWYIGYHWVIYGNGEARRYRDDEEVGAHTKEQAMNFKSIGICLSGNFDAELPNEVQVAKLTELLRQYNFKEVYPHRHFATYKSCYGNKLPDDWASNLIRDEFMNQTKVGLSKDGKTVYECTPIAIDIGEYRKQAKVEGIAVPDIIPPISDF